MRHLYFATILLVMFSCDNKSKSKDIVEYSNGQQLLSVNNIKRDGTPLDEPRIERIAPDSLSVGGEFIAKIFLAETDLVIADAFVDCDNVIKASVDTVTYKVSGCKTGLMVKDDTIWIGFKPTNVGLKTFSTITILTKDKERVFRTMEYTFDYNVVKN
jgi:hypothetical protein